MSYGFPSLETHEFPSLSCTFLIYYEGLSCCHLFSFAAWWASAEVFPAQVLSWPHFKIFVFKANSL